MFRAAVAAVVAVTLFVFVKPAHSEQALGVGGGIGATTTTTLGPTLTLGTTGAIIYFIVRKPETDGGTAPGAVDAGGGGYVMNQKDAAPLVYLYLRDHGTQLTSDIAQGGGGSLNDLAVALGIPAEHRAAFAGALYRARGELSDLARGDKLNETRAGEFFGTVGDAMAADPVLQSDYASLRNRSI